METPNMSCFSVAYIARHRGFSGTMAPREKNPRNPRDRSRKCDKIKTCQVNIQCDAPNIYGLWYLYVLITIVFMGFYKPTHNLGGLTLYDLYVHFIMSILKK